MSLNMLLRIFLPIVIGAVIGYATNTLAIWMLFHPKKQKRVAGLRIPGTPGVVPKERERLAAVLGEAVADKLMTHDDIVKLVAAVPYERHIVAAVDEVIDRRVSGVLPESVVYRLKVAASRAVLKEVGRVIEDAGPEMLKSIDVATAVREKVLSFDVDEIEALVFRVAGKELRYIEALGGVIGAAIGAVQAALGFWL